MKYPAGGHLQLGDLETFSRVFWDRMHGYLRGCDRLEMNGAASWPRSVRYQEARKSATMQADDQKKSRTGNVAVSF